MVIFMYKVCYVKSKVKDSSFAFPKALGMNVIELEEPEQIDETLKGLVADNTDVIFLSKEIAGFSRRYYY